ncbi:helix-turn-helix domain-containing protein [Treponema brennaborense]|uniref:Helix-turn-helix domain protein n=1 Tax=Treponema brennaborense (strain DSM 12168 / CIP 105900 / DD5/3) TaxID=906968 RepID=F4LIX9_TREBD|nr:helix-turn-helix transcriptional regulator [Treponema brennaborense]AEE17288.1 helix-turn-helix domain protein [Treponema brennaborense DSM 12168]
MNCIGKEIDYAAIGRRIKKYRWESNISQEELADAVGVSTTHMSHIETGGTKLSLGVFVKIADALQISADLLLNGDRATSKLSEIDELFSASDERQSRILLEITRAAKNALDRERV